MKKRKTGEIGLFTGKTRSGKTYQLQKRIKPARRALVWSVKEPIDLYAEVWPDSVKVRGLDALKNAVLEIGSRPAHLIYLPSKMSEFGDWARLAHAWGIIAPCSVVGEELADVTTPGKAPDGWGNLIRQGAGWGINIYGVTQRPSESDKTIVGNLSFLHCHQQFREQDRAYIAREMDLPIAEISKLTGYKWIERWADGRIKRG